jgi:hypothetical protein
MADLGFVPDELEGLKRKQLQALCKTHGIKANGKVLNPLKLQFVPA